ncbi:MAG TPA: SEC-C metal-binding domain-containing protein, partial [Planctomycetaceae bacterium]|nr:SEC-C metal-binding domain-containing protein [Planctomycetaceae bacterium]
AQKKREEYHFDVRKNLLEYDEVMDEQRKQIYSYRQRILDGGDCRVLIETMIGEQLEVRVPEFLDPAYSRETIVAWAEHRLGLFLKPDTLKGMDQEQLEEYIREEAESQAEDHISDQIETHLPEDVEDEREWNWLALSKWANSAFALNTSDKELKKIGRDELQMYLFERAKEAVSRLDLSDVGFFMQEDYGRRSLCAWLEQQFALVMQPEDFEKTDSTDAALAAIRADLERFYEEKETEFPVSVGMNRFMSEQAGGYNDREGLIRWANHRFDAELDPAAHSTKPRAEMAQILRELSQAYFAKGSAISELDERLDAIFTDEKTLATEQQRQELADWSNSQFGGDLDAEKLRNLNRDQSRIRINDAYQAKFRPELRQAERSLILEVVDTAWKEHLYYMDHLRSGIGLVGYAQKDPKVEYKREGRRAFKGVWNRIGNQVTGAIFRMDRQSPDFVGSLWRITSVEHEDGRAAVERQMRQQTRLPEPGSSKDVVEPIKNVGPKVGRNDLCPCGSGKKYKKCCGQV